MPRIEELVGFAPAVRDCEVAEINHETQQITAVPGKQLAFGDQLGNQIRISMSLEGRDELVRLLTGGIVLADHLPQH